MAESDMANGTTSNPSGEPPNANNNNKTWSGFKNKIGNITRWTFVAATFAALIISIVSLWEVMSFQDHVREIATKSDTSYEKILQSIGEASKLTPSPESARLQRIAITLDSLEHAAEQLEKFRGLKRKSTQEAQPQMARQLLTEVGTRMNRLRQSLYEHWPLTEFAMSLANLEKSITQLEQFTVSAARFKKAETTKDLKVLKDMLPQGVGTNYDRFERARTQVIDAIEKLPLFHVAEPGQEEYAAKRAEAIEKFRSHSEGTKDFSSTTLASYRLSKKH